jgi:hypothetical protein
MIVRATPVVRAAVLVCVLASGVSCARPFAPPGGERDVNAPRLLSTTPEPLAVIAAGAGPVVFRFNERISERGFSETLVSVSPLDSALRVDRSGSEVRVRIDGGWRANRVYRVVLLPGIRDLFGNERREPVELVFSTGAPVGNTALAGIVIDRLTGRPARQGVVDATHTTERARYTAIADSSGFYSLRYLPIGEYDVRAYDDHNGNRRRDFLEPVDSGHPASFQQPTDTVALIFTVLSPDTTAPRVMSARAIDSLHVRIEIDDYFDPYGPGSISADVHWMPDSVRYAGSSRVVPEPVFNEEQRAASAAAADTIAAADTAAVVAVPTDVVPQTGQVPDAAEMLPQREFVVMLDRPLVPGSYTITVSGVINLQGIAGGGIARFDVAAPAPPPEPPPEPGTPPVQVPAPAPPDTSRIGAVH